MNKALNTYFNQITFSKLFAKYGIPQWLIEKISTYSRELRYCNGYSRNLSDYKNQEFFCYYPFFLQNPIISNWPERKILEPVKVRRDGKYVFHMSKHTLSNPVYYGKLKQEFLTELIEGKFDDAGKNLKEGPFLKFYEYLKSLHIKDMNEKDLEYKRIINTQKFELSRAKHSDTSENFKKEKEILESERFHLRKSSHELIELKREAEKKNEELISFKNQVKFFKDNCESMSKKIEKLEDIERHNDLMKIRSRLSESVEQTRLLIIDNNDLKKQLRDSKEDLISKKKSNGRKNNKRKIKLLMKKF